MSVEKHADFQQEVNKLNDVMHYVEDTITLVKKNRMDYQGEIKDAYVNLDYLDSSLSYSSIMLNSTLLDELEQHFNQLLLVKKKPYFARIDLTQEGMTHKEKLYIGKMTLFDLSMDVPMIVDWRAPIASVYYEGRLGDVSYEAHEKTHHVAVDLKRQYTINDGVLEGIMDIDITTTDTFLQAALEGHAEDKLKDIVSTIQAEQNAIIRADINRPLIVQGVAGSGKTTIALHRIAYLIYTYADTFYPENFMILAPNRLFLDYISQVLPELGADKVKQTTYIDFMYEVVGKKYKLTSSNAKLIALIESSDEKEIIDAKKMIRTLAGFKGSMLMKDIIEAYVQDIEQNFVPEGDFALGDYILFDQAMIKELFLDKFSYLPIYKRVDSIKQYISHRLKSEKKRILEEIENKYNKELDYIRDSEPASEEKRLKLVNLVSERDLYLDMIQKKSKSTVVKYMAQFPKVDAFDYYKELITNQDLLAKYAMKKEQTASNKADLNVLQMICENASKLFVNNHIELEDLAPIAYLKYKLSGRDKKLDIKYVVMDEAQDFSYFEFFMLKEVLGTELFTILGDLSQGIHEYRAIDNWDFVSNNIFNKENSNFLTLEQSYRTTVEIMDAANEIITQCAVKGLVLAKPVVRHGQKPRVKAFDCEKMLIEETQKQIMKLNDEGFKSIALIGKTIQECSRVQKNLAKNKVVHTKLLDEKDKHYSDDIVIIPAYLAKGLEFDAVIIINIEDYYTEDALDLKLLYVAMTRALHRLYVFFKEGKIPVVSVT